MSETRISSLWGKITILLIICCFSFSAQAKYGGGTGEPNDPYQIRDANHMQAIGADSNDWDKHFKLCADIDLAGFSGASFNIIGNSATNFTGVFDGNNHTISNFTYDSNGTDYIGLFGYIDAPNAEIRNLGLIDPNVDAGTGSQVGSLVSYLTIGTITNCYAEGGSVSGNGNVGGLVGYNAYGCTVTNCHSTGDVSGNYYVGGLMGINNGGTVNSSYSSSRVSGTGGTRSEVAGLVGGNIGTVRNSYSTGSVSGDYNVGGLVGFNSVDSGTVSNSYSTCSVSGDGPGVGGLVGWNMRGGLVSSSYATGSVSGIDYFIGGLVGANNGTVSNSYSTGIVWGNNAVGGLVGTNDSGGTVGDSYATGTVSGNNYVGGLVGYENLGNYTKSFWDSDVNPDINGIGNTTHPNVIGESTANMQTKSTFADAGWDFVGEVINGTDDIWDICEGTNYPKLVWQIPVGDFLCPDGVDFVDYSFFASHWAEDNCGASNDCDGTDLDLLETVDINDLRIFVDNWLRGF